MSSGSHGDSSSTVEVTNISPHGFWIMVREKELFLPFEEFPWFRDATVSEITDVQLPAPNHLYWPALDVDLTVESVEHPERFPLKAQVQPKGRT